MYLHTLMWTTNFQFSNTGQPIALHVFGKRDAKHRRPVVVYFHGGLFNCGNVEGAYAIASALSGHAVIVCVEYPLAPCMHFPHTMEVAYEALAWVANNARLIGANAKACLSRVSKPGATWLPSWRCYIGIEASVTSACQGKS